MEPSEAKTSEQLLPWFGVAVLVGLTVVCYLLFQSTRNYVFVLPGIVTFTLAVVLILRQVPALRKYEQVVLTFIVGMVLFLLFLDETIAGLPNPVHQFNEVLLDSALADLQTYLTSVVVVAVLQLFFMVLVVSAGGIFVFLLKQGRQPLSPPIPWSQKLPWFSFVGTAAILFLTGIVGLLTYQRLGLDFTFVLVQSKTSVIYFPASPDGPSDWVLVNEACSGIHSLVVFLGVFYLATLYMGRTVPKSTLLGALLVGTLGTVTSNWLRVTLVLLVGYLFGLDLMFTFHDYAGLVIFLGWVLLFWTFAMNHINSKANPENYSKA